MSAPAPPPSRAAWLAAGGLLILVVLFHGQALRDGFVYDDWWTLVANPIVRAPGNALALWGPALARAGVPDAGRPLMLVSEMIDHALFGEAATGYHLQNLLWHAAVVLLQFFLWRRLTGRPFVAFAAAALFAVHPLLVEPVAAINYREDLLAAAFVLLALWVLRGRADDVGWGRRLLAACLVALAAFAKESAYLAPGLLALIDRAPGSARRGRARLDLAALAAAVSAVFLWRWWVMGAPAVVSQAAESAAHPRTAALAGFVASSLQLIWPVGLSPEYADPASRALGFGALALVLLVVITAALALHRRASWAAFGLLMAITAALPNLGLVSLTNARADRYLYLPAVGLCLAVASGLAALLAPTAGRPERTAFEVPISWLVLAAVILALGIRTLHQGRIWRDDGALFAAAVRVAPGSPRAWAGLARAQLRAGQTMAALANVDRALALDNGDPHARELRGIVLLAQGDHADARVELERALAVMPGGLRAEALNNLGFAELEDGAPAAAIPRFVEAERLAPRYDRPALNRSRALRLGGDDAAAEAVLRALVARIPESSDGWKQLGALLARTGRGSEAIAAYRRAQKLTPADREVARALAELAGG